MIAGRPVAAGRNRFDRSLAITIVTGLVLILILGLVFSVAYGSQRITSSAGSLHDADETLRSATVVRAQFALASLMNGMDREFGTRSQVPIEFSLGEADQALGDLETGISSLRSAELTTPATEAAYTEYLATVDETRRLIGERAPGDSQGSAGMPEAFRSLVDELVIIRDDLGAAVDTSDQLLGRIGNLARFLVAFLVPAAVILIYRELVRRQQRQAELETRLEAERRINLAQEQFIANASHELRTPLTSIMGLSMTLAESEAVLSDAAASELVGIIVGESEELARMVEDLLTVARLDAGALHYTFDDVSIHEELDDIRDGAVRAGMRVTADVEPCTVRADRLRLRQILRNLLSNARKYGGPNIRIEGHIDGHTYVCSVIDDGPGIPEELRPRLFQRFIHQGQKTTASRDSVGLGLSIVHSLALGMGGSIQYDSIDGESHFLLRLPLTQAVLPAEEALPAAQTAS
ncbi:MAG: HAMP domain-containing histidine kinase [Acidimicrobiia bacterium]|nr:HAMP domain-containing histidine kinase [Acidimicrobiia bacterium]